MAFMNRQRELDVFTRWSSCASFAVCFRRISKSAAIRGQPGEVRDPYLRFYFEFVYRHPEWLEQGRISHMRRVIESRFDAYVGKQVYEEWARRHLMELGDADELSFVPDEVGRAWNPRVEIDVLAVNWKERSVIAGECKWRRGKIGARELASLQDRCGRLKRIQGFKVQYTLFSKGGFSNDILNSADAAELLLFEGSQFTRIHRNLHHNMMATSSSRPTSFRKP